MSAGVRLSDALLAGAAVLKTNGPTLKQDIWVCAQAGILGREPSPSEACLFYWDNEWMDPGDDLEWWARLVVFDKPRWHLVVSALQQLGG